MDVLKNPGATGGPLTEAENTVKSLPDGQIKKTLEALLDSAEGNLEKISRNIEVWFDDSMDRVSGWYKRTAKKWMMGIAFLLAVALNVDSIEVAKELWRQPTMRAVIVENAATFVSSDNSQTVELTIEELEGQLNQLQLPIGWPTPWGLSFDNAGLILLSLTGWIFTAVAVSLGAPFWFDGLGKLLSIRAAGKQPERATK